VAITRARHQIVVVGSMPIEQISEALGTAAAPGVNLKPRCYLQLYLAYARAVAAGDEDQVKRILDRLSHASAAIQAQGGPESPLEVEVLHEIKRLGYRVDCQVGESGFRIDLAVWHPDPEQGYLLGIECDGATYHSDRAAHLRDVWRETILCSRGWKLHRVWSTRWWYHRAEEIEKLEYALAAACLGKEPHREAAPSIAVDSREPPIKDAQTMHETAPNQNHVAPLPVSESRVVQASRFDQSMTLGQLRDKLASSGEFRGSWERFLEFVELPRGLGLKKDTTLTEAQKLAATLAVRLGQPAGVGSGGPL
jgi:hypothetical protein